MVDTLFNRDNLKFQCYECRTDLKDNVWESEHDEQRHYKSTLCTCCGKKHSVKVDFLGSGHDSWDGTESWKMHVDWEHQQDVCKIRPIKNLVELIKQK